MNKRARWCGTFSIAMLATLGATAALATPRPVAGADGSSMGSTTHPGCEGIDAHACLDLALQAMGGREKLAGIHDVQLDVIGHTALTEQSYRQAPFITSYERDQLTVDFDKGRLLEHNHAVWPESDPHQAEGDVTLIATSQGGVYHGKQGDAPCSASDLDDLRATLSLAPERLLLTAAAAPDLHYANDGWLRSTPHSALEFRWNGQPVRVLINAFNHLPDALERTAAFRDFWFAWGDVDQRVYFDNWHLFHGVVYPTNQVEVRNGVAWKSSQVLDAIFNAPLDDKNFAMDEKAAHASMQSPGWDRPFNGKKKIELAPGVELYRGAWNATLIRQQNGVLVLEAPIAPSYAKAVFDKARSEFPGAPLLGVLTTSDSWPHIAGVREAVAEGVTVYALDLNRPLLAKLIAAPHRLHPDALQISPMPAQWRTVSGRLEMGRGANRVVAYPLRGASTERQYMVYFPQHRLLYASDTLAINPDHTLYDLQLMHEVVQAVQREHLKVDTVFAMHEGPTPWSEVEKLVAAAGK
ncbi:hypothetical protein [Rhodanobacter sp. L36]|uniref:hypothetical protein n=1 Tax=Rhodanobacter sp. L36 TaxID=1747221 RepID=UPI00131D2AD6|nr:hypothetical protein [Rhodanobacter sp. L36]